MAAATIRLGDDTIAKFWHSHWLEGQTPKSLASAIYTISKRKNRSVVLCEKPWVGTSMLCDKQDRDLFMAAATIRLGDDTIAKFWHSHWLEGQTPKSLASAIYTISKRKNRSVQQALEGNTWITEIQLGHISALTTCNNSSTCGSAYNGCSCSDLKGTPYLES
nr:OSJNBb0072M01.16 [Oryza sativa Japonica Group]CAE05441.1 OSJNBa0073E02.1 [Oryza sativa Japonica Group]